jgi:hypothetical protein
MGMSRSRIGSMDAPTEYPAAVPPRRWSPWRFSLRTMLIAIAITCAWLAWRYSVVAERRRLICNQFVDSSLLANHWAAMEQQPSSGSVAFWATTFISQKNCRCDFLKPDGKFDNGATADDFEKRLLAEWTKPQPAVGTLASQTATRQSLNGPFIYYKAIRADTSQCILCHGFPKSQSKLTLGDLIGVAKIELTD